MTNRWAKPQKTLSQEDEFYQNFKGPNIFILSTLLEGSESIKLNMELPDDTAILLGIYLKKMKTLIWKKYMHFNVHAALFTVAKIWKQPKYPSTDEWIKKTHTCVCVCVCVFV